MEIQKINYLIIQEIIAQNYQGNSDFRINRRFILHSYYESIEEAQKEIEAEKNDRKQGWFLEHGTLRSFKRNCLKTKSGGFSDGVYEYSIISVSEAKEIFGEKNTRQALWNLIEMTA
jgi:hypothetical protein